MFTGIIEEIGIIREILSIPGGVRLGIEANRIFSDLKVDDSVNINGACQTVVALRKPIFWVEAVGDTLKKTTFSSFRAGVEVNLERAVTPSTRLGGHLVQGHVNGTGKIQSITKRGKNWMVTINLPPELMRYCVQEGSIAIDGVSLTIAERDVDSIRISIIPHTVEKTIIKHYQPGMEVNVEVDVIIKYLEALLKKGEKNFPFSLEDLQQMGF